MDAIQEIAYQTSNYAPEFGPVGRRVHQHDHEVRHQPISRQRLRLLRQRRPECRRPFQPERRLIAGPTGKAAAPSAEVEANFVHAPAATISAAPWAARSTSPKSITGTTRASSSSTMRSSWRPPCTPSTIRSRGRLSPGQFRRDLSEWKLQACAHLGIQTTALGTPTVQLDPLGNHLYANEIYDPATRAVATSGSLSGQGYATPFPNNVNPRDPLRSGRR